MARPAALGISVTINSLADADLVLAELSYLETQNTIVDAEIKQAVDTLKTNAEKRLVVTVEGQTFTISDRIAKLTEVLEPWVQANIAEHLKGNARSIKLAHGTLGLRQQPLTISVPEKQEAEVLRKINTATQGFIQRIRNSLIQTFRGWGSASDFLSLKFGVNTKNIKAAYEAERLSKAKIESLGLIVREAFDAPEIKPAECVTAAD